MFSSQPPGFALGLPEESFLSYPLAWLPRLPSFDTVLNQTEEQAAKRIYSVILAAEAAAYTAAEDAPQDENPKVNLIYARVVGCILLCPPGITARELVIRQIEHHRAQTDSEKALHASIYDFGKYRTFGFIVQFRRWENCRNDSWSEIEESPMSVGFKKSRRQVLKRDGCRCMVTRLVEVAAAGNHPVIDAELRKEREEGKVTGLVPTTCCRIFDLFMGHFDDPFLNERKCYVDAFTTIMKQFGYTEIANRLTRDDCQGINAPENLMTLYLIVESFFRGLYLWFEEIPDEQNTYSVVCRDERLYGHSNPIPRKVTFISNETDVPLPDPEYLHIHAAASRIATFSGAAVYFLYNFEDTERETILLDDSLLDHMRNYRLVSLT